MKKLIGLVLAASGTFFATATSAVAGGGPGCTSALSEVNNPFALFESLGGIENELGVIFGGCSSELPGQEASFQIVPNGNIEMLQIGGATTNKKNSFAFGYAFVPQSVLENPLFLFDYQIGGVAKTETTFYVGALGENDPFVVGTLFEFIAELKGNGVPHPGLGLGSWTASFVRVQEEKPTPEASVPEPSTVLALGGVTVLGFGLGKKRKAA